MVNTKKIKRLGPFTFSLHNSKGDVGFASFFIWCQWVIPTTAREFLLGWNPCKGEAKNLECRTVVHFLDGLEGNEWIVFRDVLSIQRLKSFFVCLLWSETKLFFVDV